MEAFLLHLFLDYDIHSSSRELDGRIAQLSQSYIPPFCMISTTLAFRIKWNLNQKKLRMHLDQGTNRLLP